MGVMFMLFSDNPSWGQHVASQGMLLWWLSTCID